MADFSALKTAIQTYIKQNGNEEITGEILQEILLSVVTTLGDTAINNLVTALANEVAARQNADGTLQQNITNEATARGNADTALGGRIDDEATARQQADNTLQGLINGIKGNIDNGYVYAGIATPSSTPTTGKVFYLALTAGTYTNFGSTEVSQGINILKYNGSAWSLDAFIGIDDEPTPNSPKLVKSGGTFDSIMTDGSAFDISAHFASGGTLATYADLSAALAALNTLSASYKRGGMSIKFVQSSDNKYVQYRLMSDDWSTDVADWQGVDEEPTEDSKNLVESGGVDSAIKSFQEWLFNGGYVAVEIDASKNILSAVDAEGVRHEFLLKVYHDHASFENGLTINDSSEETSIDSVVYVLAVIDNNKNMVFGIKDDGTIDIYSLNANEIHTDVLDTNKVSSNFAKLIKKTSKTESNLICIGDSLTFGYGSTSGHDYPSLLAKWTGINSINYGFSGDDSAMIIGYLNAKQLLISPTTIPATGSVNVEISDYKKSATNPFTFPRYAELAGINPVCIGGIKGNLDLSASQNPGTKVFSFTRLEEGDAYTFTEDVPMGTSCKEVGLNDVYIVFIGTNGGWSSIDELIAQNDALIKSKVGANKYIVIGITSLGNGASPEMEAQFKSHYGWNYINMREYLLEYGLSDNDITPTQEDTERIEEGLIPTSLLVDGVHFNDYGYNSVAKAIYNRGKVLNYWD